VLVGIGVSVGTGEGARGVELGTCVNLPAGAEVGVGASGVPRGGAVAPGVSVKVGVGPAGDRSSAGVDGGGGKVDWSCGARQAERIRPKAHMMPSSALPWVLPAPGS